MEKYRKLIIAQIAGFAGAAAFVFAFMRYQQVPNLQDPTFMSFVAFGALLLVAEARTLFVWVGERKKLQDKEAQNSAK